MKRLLILLLLMSPGTAGATDHYINAAVSGGNDDGSDWTNAWATLPATLVRGDTYWIGDGTYAPYVFNDAVSGNAVITIKKATVAAHGTNTGWNNAYGDGQAVFTGTGNIWIIKTNNWIFDGVSATNDTLGHGFKLVPTGELAKGIEFRGPSSAGVAVADSIEFRYIEIAQQGVDNVTGDDGIYVNLSTDEGWCTDVLVSHCYIHDAGRLHMILIKCSNWIIEHTYCARNSSSAETHSESIVAWGCDTMTIRYCTFADIEGSGVIVMENDDKVGGLPNTDFDVYGNLFFCSYGNPYNREGTGPNGPIGSNTAGYVNNLEFYNNTIVNWSYGLNSGIYINHGTGNQCYNNLWFNCADWATEYNNAVMTSNYNWFVNTERAYGSTAGASDVVTAAADTNTVFTDHLNYDFTLLGASPPGVELDAAFQTDRNGASRGDDNLWDIGAYEYDSVLTTVWLDGDAEEDGDGTQSSPFNSLASAVAAMNSGAVCYWKGNLGGTPLTVPEIACKFYKWPGADPPILGGAKPLTGWTAAVAGGGVVTDSLSTQIGGHDAQFTHVANGADTQTKTGTTIDAGVSTNLYYAGFQFVPPVASIDTFTVVYLRLVSALNRANTPSLQIWAWKNTAVPGDTLGWQTTLADTTNVVGGSIAWDLPNMTAGTEYSSPDIASLLNGLDMANGDSVLIVVGNREGAAAEYLRFSTFENTTYAEPRLAYSYQETGSPATFSYRALAEGAERLITRVWEDGESLEQVADSSLVESGKYAINVNKLYVAIGDTSGITCDGYGANAIDFNEKTDVTVSGITILGTGYSDHAIYADGSRNSIYNINIDRAKKGIYALGDTITFRNIAFAVTDTLLTETGTGAVYTHNAFDTDYEVPASPGANDVLAAELWTGENYEPTEEMRDKGYDVGLPYNGSAPEIGPVELEALIVDTATFRRGYGVGRWGDALQKRWGGSPW